MKKKITLPATGRKERSEPCGAEKARTKKYLSGKVTLGEFGEEQTIQVVIYSNKFKEKDNQPDFRIYKSEPAAQSAQPSESAAPASPATASESVDPDIPDVLQ